MNQFNYAWMDLVPYENALDLQKRLRSKRINGDIENTLLMMEHPPVITTGTRNRDSQSLQIDPDKLEKRGIQWKNTKRGGGLTYHGPGQLLIYPIFQLQSRDLHTFLEKLVKVSVNLLSEFGISAKTKLQEGGVFVDDQRIGSLGIKVRKWVNSHGIALNVDLDCRPFDYLRTDSHSSRTTMEDELKRAPLMENVTEVAVKKFSKTFNAEANSIDSTEAWDYAYNDLPSSEERKMRPRRGQPDKTKRKPEWLRAELPGGENFQEIRNIMDDKLLNTVCEEASCPNLGECWSRGTATFMILGDTCTRACGFCDVDTGTDLDVDKMEPFRVARAVNEMNLDYVVITSVNRDDLSDGGAGIWANTIRQIRNQNPDTNIEVLIPDFMGDWDALRTIFDADPEILNHNVETVPRLYPSVRPKARYDRSLELLSRSYEAGFPTKSGLMLGIGERKDEITRTLEQLYDHGVRILTLGQYLRPSENHLPVDRWVHPEEFDRWQKEAESFGFEHVESGPLVRSSYHADEQVASSHAL